MPRVIVTEPVHEQALEMLRSAGWKVLGPGADLAPADALLVRTRAVSSESVGLFRLISKHGVGVDNIALDAARAKGVAVMNTPGANSAAVAEQTIMLMLALARDLAGQEQAARLGRRVAAIGGLEGRRLLVVGQSETGRRVAGFAAAFGMTVATVAARSGVEKLRAALPEVDVLSLHCALSPQTKGLIGAAELALLPRGAFVVNVARGGLVKEDALVDALESGHLGGAALDVTEEEPLPLGHPLLAAPRLILTPHAAGSGEAAFRRMGLEAARNILDHFAGVARKDCVVA